MNEYERILQAARDEALQKPKTPPPGSTKEELAAYADALDSWHFEKQCVDLARMTEVNTAADKQKRATQEAQLSSSGSFGKSKLFTSSILMRQSSGSILAQLIAWLDSESEALDPELFPAHLVCVRPNALTGKFDVKCQSASPTSSFVLVTAAPESASSYDNPASHAMASVPPHKVPLSAATTFAAAGRSQPSWGFLQQPPAKYARTTAGKRGAMSTSAVSSLAPAPSAPAPSYPMLKPGDRIVAVNGVSLAGLGISFVNSGDGKHASLCFAVFTAVANNCSVGQSLLLTVRRAAAGAATGFPSAPLSSSSSSSFPASSSSSWGGASGISSSSSLAVAASPAAFFGASAASRSFSTASFASLAQIDLALPVRPRWSYVLSSSADSKLRELLLNILRTERDALRSYGDFARQHITNKLLPMLGDDLNKYASWTSTATLDNAREAVLSKIHVPAPPIFQALKSVFGAAETALLLSFTAIVKRFQDGVYLQSSGSAGHVPGKAMQYHYRRPEGQRVRTVFRAWRGISFTTLAKRQLRYSVLRAVPRSAIVHACSLPP